MILIDYNQVLIANIMVQLKGNRNELDENLIRHMVLNNLRQFMVQFRGKYGEVVICCESSKSWRKDYFPFYKAHRKKDREDSIYNWTLIFETLLKVKDELKTYAPYKVLEVDGAEADDIIAALTKEYHTKEEILILSSDKDFIQLQKYPNVVQYSPILKRFISTENPTQFIREHILKGDRGDGIPNFLSADNTFVAGERQKTITTKKLKGWLDADPQIFCTNDTMLRGFMRNQMLIDLDHIPDRIREAINEAYLNTKPSKGNLLDYFIKYRLKNLTEVLDEF